MKKCKKILSLLIASAMMISLSPLMIAHAYDIVGVSKVARAPIGMTAAHPYSVEGVENVVWRAENAPEGVTMTKDGVLLVPGETILTNNWEMSVVAEDEDGNFIAEKPVTILDKLNPDKTNYDWVDYPKRAYMNFEIFSAGDAPNSRFIAQANWDDVPMRYSASTRTTSEPCTIKEEENGNKYVSATGANIWSTTGCTFAIYPKFDRDTYNCFYGQFMIEDPTASYNLVFLGTILDLSYAPISETETGIYLNAVSGETISPKKHVATVKPGEWFDLWINYYFTDNTFEVYLDGKKIVDRVSYTGNFLTNIYVGSAFDNAAYFTGFYAPAQFPGVPEEVYITEGMDNAVVTLDNSMRYGNSRVEGKAEHEILEAGGAELIGSKLFVSKDSGNIEIASKELRIPLEEALANEGTGANLTIQTPHFYGAETVRTIKKSEGIFYDEIDSSFGFIPVSVPDVKGGLMISFEYSGDLSATFSGNGESFTIYGDYAENMEEVQIFLDTVNGEYYAFSNEKLFDSGETNLMALSEIAFAGLYIENFTLSSISTTAPYVLSPTIKGNTAVGQTLKADYDYYSPWGCEKTEEKVEWLISDTADGEYEKIGEGANLLVPENAAGKYIKYQAVVSDDRQESAVTESDAVYIYQVLEISLGNDTLTADIRNIANSEELIVGAMLYSEGELIKTVFNRISFYGAPGMTWETDAEGAEGAVVSLLYPEDLSPVCLSKAAGTVGSLTETSVKSETATVKDGKLCFTTEPNTITSVVIYGNKSSDSDPASVFSKVYTREEILDEADDEVIGKVKYIYNVETPSDGSMNIILPELEAGSYFAEIMPRGSEMQTCLWMSGTEELFTEEMMESGSFVDVLKLYSDKTDAAVEESYNLYKGIENKDKVQLLMNSVEGDASMFDLAALVINYLERTNIDAAYRKLKDELKLRQFDTVAADLLNEDGEKAVTAKKILEADWNSIDTLLDVMYEKAVLYGIHHVKNYKETDVFLKTLTDTVYSTSKHKSKIQERVATKLYKSLEELCEDVNKPVSSGGTGGGGGGGGGSSSGGSSESIKDKKEETTVKVYEDKDGVKVSKSAFSDVPTEHWANEAIYYLFDNKIVNGTPEGLYHPEKHVTRAEFVKIICEAFKLASKETTSFSDVNAESWYAKYCSVAGSLGIVLGSEGAFRPEDNITREDAAVIIYRVLTYKGIAPEVGNKMFLDQASISVYAVEATKTLASAGLISGMGDNTFCPGDNMTKAQCAQIVFNCLRR